MPGTKGAAATRASSSSLRPVLDRLASFFRHIIGRNDKILEPQEDTALVRLDLDRERAQLEKMDVPLLDGALVHHVTRNAEETHLDIRRRSLLLGDLVQFEG